MKLIDAEKLLEDIDTFCEPNLQGSIFKNVKNIINRQPEIKGEPVALVETNAFNSNHLLVNYKLVTLREFVDMFEHNTWLYTTTQDQSARIAELEGKLRGIIPYAKHGKGYEKMCEQMKHGEYPCTCGLERLLKQIGEV